MPWPRPFLAKKIWEYQYLLKYPSYFGLQCQLLLIGYPLGIKHGNGSLEDSPRPTDGFPM
jgi:hypothetical protein